MKNLSTLPLVLGLALVVMPLFACGGEDGGEPAPAAAVTPAVAEPEPPQLTVDWNRVVNQGELPYESEYPPRLDIALVQAHEQGMPLLLRFFNATANNKMSEETYAHKRVRAATRRYLLAEINVQFQVELLHAFTVKNAPTHIVISPEGEVVARDNGFRWPRYFANWLKESWPLPEDELPAAGSEPTAVDQHGAEDDPEGS